MLTRTATPARAVAARAPAGLTALRPRSLIIRRFRVRATPGKHWPLQLLCWQRSAGCNYKYTVTRDRHCTNGTASSLANQV